MCRLADRKRRVLAALLEHELFPQRSCWSTLDTSIQGFLMREETSISLVGDMQRTPVGYLLFRVVETPGTDVRVATMIELAVRPNQKSSIRVELMERFKSHCERRDYNIRGDNLPRKRRTPRPERQSILD